MVRSCLVILIVAAAALAQQNRPADRRTLPPVAPGFAARLAKWKPVQMPFDSSRLTTRERQMVEKLAEASQDLDNIFWRQSDPEGLALYKRLEGDANPVAVSIRRLLMINGGRFDLIDNNTHFVGRQAYSPGAGLYPRGLTRQDIERYVREHPDKKAELYSPYTLVRWRGQELVGTPYTVAFKPFLDRAAARLREAAALSGDPAFAKFLDMRASALLSDHFFQSDLAWLDLNNPKFDVIFAPYETYLDNVLGVKTSYGAAVLIRNEDESRKLALYEKYIPDLQNALPVPPPDRPQLAGRLSPMEVMDSPFRGGDLRHGYQAVADNLPNDPRIHAEKGTKKIFFKNFMDARVDNVILPLAKLLMQPGQAAQVSGEGCLTFAIMHEISHGLGPAFAHRNGKQVDIREAIGPVYSGLEEAKADVVGMVVLKWLVGHGVLKQSDLDGYYASYVAGLFRTVRYGTAEAHGQAAMMEFNYLSEQNAIRPDSSPGRYVIEYKLMPGALTSLAKVLLEIESTGGRARAESWFSRYDVTLGTLASALKSARGVPVDVDPIFAFHVRVE